MRQHWNFARSKSQAGRLNDDVGSIISYWEHCLNSLVCKLWKIAALQKRLMWWLKYRKRQKCIVLLEHCTNKTTRIQFLMWSICSWAEPFKYKLYIAFSHHHPHLTQQTICPVVTNGTDCWVAKTWFMKRLKLIERLMMISRPDGFSSNGFKPGKFVQTASKKRSGGFNECDSCQISHCTRMQPFVWF